MKTNNWINVVIFAVVGIFLMACGDSTETAEKMSDKAQTMTEQAQQAGEEIKEATQETAQKAGKMAQEAVTTVEKSATAVGEWTKENIDAFMETAQSEMNDLDAKYQELESKMAGWDEAAKKEYADQMEALTEKKAQAAEQLAALEDASGDAWIAAKEKLDALMVEIKELYEKIHQKILAG